VVCPQSGWNRGFGRTLRALNRALRRSERRNLDLLKLLHNFSFRKCAEHTVRQLNPDFIYERYSLWAVAGMQVARRHSLPLVLEVNAPLAYEEQIYRAGLTFPPLARWVERRLWRNANVTIPVSEVLRQRMIAAGVAAERIHVLPNAVDTDLFHPNLDGHALRDCLQIGERFVIGFVGSFKGWHGVDLLLDAFHDLYQSDQSAHLLLVGDGPMREALQEQARNLGLQGAVTFAGGVPHAEIPQYLATMQLAIAPYPALEDFYYSPLKLFEYMAAGLAVVSSRIGQVAEIITDGVNGLLFAPGDRTGLVECIQRLRKNPELRMQLGRRAAEACSQYTWEQHALKVIEWVEPLKTHSATPSPAASDLQGYPLSDVGGKR
jgi:glycosyltransferase involved in cell wall biosynthesis